MNKKINKKCYFLLLVFCILSQSESLLAQSMISGYIKDSLSLYPIKDVSITLFSADQTSNSTFTDDRGYFVLESKNFNDSILLISKDNFASKELKFTSGSPIVFLDTIFMSQEFVLEDDINVFGEKFFIELKPNKRVINIKDKMITRGKRVIDILKMTPYISVDGDGNIYLKNSESFILQIDGREVPKQTIESMPADLIDRIEIINNPGSKYSSQATSGVLNIITKEGISESTFGSITLWGNSLDQYNSYSSIDYSKGKVRLYSNISGTIFNGQNEFTSSHTSQNSNYTEFGNNTTKFKNLNFRGGFIFELASNKSMDFVSYVDLGSLNGNFVYNQPLTNTAENYKSQSSIDGPSHRYYFSSIYSQFNKDTSFKSDIQVDFLYTNNENSYYYEQYLKDGLISLFRDNSGFSHSNAKLNGDFVSKIFANSYIEYGLFLNYLNESNDRENDTLEISTGEFYRNSDLSGNFTNREKNAAVYSQLITELGNLTLSTGARGVYNNLNILVDEKNINSGNNYFLILPNIQLSYRLKDYSLLEGGYNYGYKKPRSFMLNPVERINRGTDIFKGNPDLNVEKIHTLNLSYSRQFKEITFSPSLNYVYSTDLISLISTDIDSVRTLTTYENINYSKDLNFEINIVFPIRNLVYINSDLILGWQEYNDSRNNEILSNTYYNIKIQTNFTITEFLSLNINYILNSNKLKNQTLYKLNQSLNGAISLNLFDNLNITLLGNDILNTDIYKTEINGLGFTRYFESDYNQRNVALTVSYNFGEFKRKKRDKRKFEKPETEEGLN